MWKARRVVMDASMEIYVRGLEITEAFMSFICKIIEK